TAVPGACAAICALTVAGLPSDRFLFAGFPPSSKAARKRFLADLGPVQATLIFYESPKRIHGLLADLTETLGGERQAAVCRELTKKFEEVLRGSVAELSDAVADRELKGEIVVLVDRAAEAPIAAKTIEEALDQAMRTMTMKDAVAHVADAFGQPRREVYQRALARKSDDRLS
ncbi:MAG: rRNA (cytidine-2'-O-)-methyltransferase, partial [Tabrizicola sp.]|nr:rRNA (cytidine-2'-O-)-methyltransferase [Tabrizicola sp.]